MQAAREQIIEHGPSVSMSSIAAAAGVAVGTLYRNFPRKTDLVDAVIAEQIEQIVEDIERTATRVADGAAAGEELRLLAHRILQDTATSHAVKVAAGVLGEVDFSAAELRAVRSLVPLVDACVDAGVLAADVTPADFQLLLATAPIDQPAPVRSRWLDIYLAGLAPR